MKRILLTTLGYTEDTLGIDFYHYQNENGQRQYCTGISVAEAGTKYILSKYIIDEIVVVASTTSVGEHDITEPVSLKDGAFVQHPSLDEYSEYGFYLYRLQQFMENLDIEAQGLLEIITPERAEELEKEMKVLRSRYGITLSKKTFFQSDDMDLQKLHSFMEYVGENFTDTEARYIAYRFFLDMDSRYKLYPLDFNRDVKVRFIPIKKENGHIFDIEKGKHILDTLDKEENDNISAYVDLQGFGFSDAFTMYNVLQIFNKIHNNRIEIAGIIQSTYNPKVLSNPIINEWDRLQLQTFLASIHLFLDYGKSDGVLDYFRKYTDLNQSGRHMLIGMRYVDEGISLCNIAALKYGVAVIREAMNSADRDNNLACIILRDLIRTDYGAMLEGRDVSIPEMLKWALKKKMYQQALSIIESHIPGDMVRRGIFYYAKNEEDIEKIKEELNVKYWNETVKCRYFFNDIDHYMIKNIYREHVKLSQRRELVSRDCAAFHVRRTREKIENVLPAYSELGDDAMLQELLMQYLNIGTLRNEVCHAEMPVDALENGAEVIETDRMELIEKKLTAFLDVYQAACDKVKDASFTSVRLTGDVFKAYTFSHRLVPFSGDEDGIMEQNLSCMFNGKEVTIKIRMQDVPEE